MYYLVYGFLYLLSLLPMGILYLLSDGVYFLIYHVFGYRKKVVEGNLRIAFPEKSSQEIIAISKRFYKNFVDNFIETLKLVSAGEDFILSRFKVAETDVLPALHAKGKRCQIHLGHNFNWELGGVAFPLLTNYQLLVVYMPLKSKVFERIMKKIRSKTGAVLLPATNMREVMMPYRDHQYLLALVADQVPGNVNRAYWLNFFGKPTPFVQGPEKGARAGDIPVVFAQIEKEKRGYYLIHFHLAEEHPGTLEPGELTRKYRDFLEEVIRKNPDMWLWSHRRWKREWKPEYSGRWIDTAPLPVTADASAANA